MSANADHSRVRLESTLSVLDSIPTINACIFEPILITHTGHSHARFSFNAERMRVHLLVDAR